MARATPEEAHQWAEEQAAKGREGYISDPQKGWTGPETAAALIPMPAGAYAGGLGGYVGGASLAQRAGLRGIPLAAAAGLGGIAGTLGGGYAGLEGGKALANLMQERRLEKSGEAVMKDRTYEAFVGHLEKMAVDEARWDGFTDELIKMGALSPKDLEKDSGLAMLTRGLGALGGALRGGGAAARGVSQMLLKGRGVSGGIGGVGKRLAGGIVGGGRAGSQLTGRHALKNVALGGLTAGGAGMAALK